MTPVATPSTPGRRVAAVPVDSPSSTTSLTVAAIEAEAAKHAYVGRRRAAVPASRAVETPQVPPPVRTNVQPIVRDRVERASRLSDDDVAQVLQALQPVDQTTGLENEDTARLAIDREQPEPVATTYVNARPVEPGKRRAVKHAGSRGPLFKALPSAPVLLGIAALAVSIGGALTVTDQAPASAHSAGPVHASALSGDSGIGKVVSGERGSVTTRDNDRTAQGDAAGEALVPAVTDLAKQREGALADLAAKTEKRAAEIALNLWHYPLDTVALTARFGQYGLWSSYHTGLDFNGDTGDPIYSIANGTVTEAGYDGAYGNKTVITLEDGTELWYCHQTAFNVSVGDVVRGGEVIGSVGSTGHVTGSHLHVEVRPGGGDPVDPYAAMQQHGLFR